MASNPSPKPAFPMLLPLSAMNPTSTILIIPGLAVGYLLLVYGLLLLAKHAEGRSRPQG